MSNQQLPNTDSKIVIEASIAWEIIERTTYRNSFVSEDEARIRRTNDFIEVYTAIQKGESIEKNK